MPAPWKALTISLNSGSCWIPARDGAFIELLHGHQFHGRHSEGFEIGNHFHQA